MVPLWYFLLDSANKLRNRCTSLECLDSAIWLIGNQNDKVNPCHYFYDNACLNYTQRYPVSDPILDGSIIGEMKEINRQRLHNVVSTKYVQGQWGQLDPTQKMTNDYYRACIDQYQKAKNYAAGANPVIGTIMSQMGQKWWVADQSKISSFNWQSSVQNAAVQDQNFIFFTLRPQLKPGSHSQYLLSFYPDESASYLWAFDHRFFFRRNQFKDLVKLMGQLLARDYGLDINDKTVSANIDTFASDVDDVVDLCEPDIHVGSKLVPLFFL